MARNASRGHLYSPGTRPAVRAWLVIALFVLAYALLVLALGTIPLNMLLRKVMGPSAMPAVWRNSVVQLLERTAVAAIACWIVMAASGRARGWLTGRGMVLVGAAMSGALAGALDVGLHRLWITQLIKAAQASHLRGYAFSWGVTAAVVVVVTLLLITRSTRPAAAPE
jgi:hypothetical protein